MKIVRKKDEQGEKTETVISLLRKIACDELISYQAYISASKNLKGSNWLDVKQEFEAHAKEELEHYENVLERLFQLGESVHAVFKTIAESCTYYWDVPTEDTRQACDIALKAEENAIKGYQKLLILILNTSIEERDFGTQRLAKNNLQKEQEHLQDLHHLLTEF